MENVGVGKSYGATKFVIKQFLKKKEKFAYIRRTKTELEEAKDGFFSKIIKNEEFPDTEFKVDGFTFYINGVEAGYAINLSTSQNKKSVNYVDLKNVIFDEFIIEERTEKILFA